VTDDETARSSHRSGAGSILGLSALLERTSELRRHGAELAALLRTAAADVDSGRPVAAARNALNDWSAEVEEHLSSSASTAEAADLAVLEQRLTDMIAAAQKDQRQLDALRAARLLHAQGLDHLVGGMLKSEGFTSLEELQAAVLASGSAPDEGDQETGEATGEDGLEAGQKPSPTVNAMQRLAMPEDETAIIAGSPPRPTPEDEQSQTPDDRPAPDDGIIRNDILTAEPTAASPGAPAAGQTKPAPGAPQAGGEAGQVAERLVPSADIMPADTMQGESKPGQRAGNSPLTIPAPMIIDAELDLRATDRNWPEPGGAPVAEDESVNFPWDAGSPPLLASLIAAGREPLAVCVAEAAEESLPRRHLLRFFCAAYACMPAALELQLPELIPPEAEIAQMGADECRVLIAAALRSGLSLGYSPVSLPPLIDRAGLGPGHRAIADAAIAAIRRGYRHENREIIERHADLPQQWAAFSVDASRLRESLALRTINLQRASMALHHIVRQDQPVGQVLDAVADLASQPADLAAADSAEGKRRWASVERMAIDLSDPARRAKIIANAIRAVSTGPQMRKPIIAGARTRLDDSVREVAELLARFVAVRSAIRLSSRAAGTPDELSRAVEFQAEAPEVMSVGDAALQRLAGWLRAEAPAEGAASISDLMRTELEPLYEIPRDQDGIPARPPDLAEVRELMLGRDSAAVLRGYLLAGNVAEARSIIAAADWPHSTDLDDEILRGTRRAEERQAAALAAVDRTAARLRAAYDDEAARSLTARAEPLRVPPDGRFDLTIGPLQKLADEGAARLQAFRDDLRRRVESSSCAAADKKRVLDLIEGEDEMLAVEFLTMAEAGESLPAAEEQYGDDFSDFFPAMVNAAAEASRNGSNVISAVRNAVGAQSGPVNRQLAAGLDAWRDLHDNKRTASDRFRPCVADILRMLGLVPRAQDWLREISKTHRSGYATFTVRAAPVDRSYIPGLGTQAHGSYDLTVVWDSVTPTRLMDFIEERRRTEANIIIYFGVLDPAQRLMLRRLTSHAGGKGFSPVVVDEAVAAWLSTRPEPGWRFTQRVTLPFTTFNPYTPFAGGEVPDEVFVGRESERQAIESPTGSMFVYGGRQLGKSALLRRVERLFTDPVQDREAGSRAVRTGRVAVYLDLKAASIGEAREPAALWAVLAQRLEDAHVLSPKTGRGVGPDEVTRQISRWLSADDTNRLLLLLDEADNFLAADFQAGRTGGGTEFPTLQRLKGLIESSGRRFKPVFAGLHQVQRFHDTSNTPVAHGGGDILIGPLRSIDAYRLVVDPMNALGYRFSSPELVWRVLLLTNYQASLVQIVCEALVRQMQDRQLPDGGGRIPITIADIESVYAKREVRDLIAQRFRWTINLDNRYRVIALVVASRSLDADPGEAFSAEELHDECEVFWPVGFSRGVLTSKEFRRYLEEMVGLGVLHRQNDQYGLRSPNVLGLLGTRESLEQELDEASRHLELQYEYNPTMNRRIIGQSTELWAPRSPLTDHDIASLLGRGGESGSAVQIVTGTHALTVDRAAQVIEDVATEQQITCIMVRTGDIDAAIDHGRGSRHVVVDVSANSAGTADLAAICRKLGSRPHVTATVVTGPAALPLSLEIADSHDVIPIRRWSIEGLRSWHESPFHTPELRARLHRVTSGWPRLVEETMLEIANGKSPDDALDWIAGRLSDPGFALQHLVSCGIDEDLAIRWATWQSHIGRDGLAEALPASLTDLTEALETDAGEVIERLQALDLVEPSRDGWVLDRVVLAAAVTLQH